MTIWTNWGKIIGPFSQWPFSFSVPNRKNTVFANQNFCYTMFFYKREALVGFIIHLRFSLRLKHISQFLTTVTFVLSWQQANWHLQKHIKVTNKNHQIKKSSKTYQGKKHKSSNKNISLIYLFHQMASTGW